MSSPTTHSARQLRLDRDRYQLLDGERPVHLERQCMELLLLLVERKGQLVTRDQIAARLWGEGVFVDTDRNITSIIRKLRQALNDDPDRPQFVETVVGKGYRFVGPLEVAPAPSQPTATEPVSPESLPAGHSWIRRNLVVIAILGCIAAALIWLAFRIIQPPVDEVSPARSVAILPLDNLSGDPAQDYFADGITQELTTELAQSSQLRVIAHTSVLQYKNSQKPVTEIAKELQVDAVIEGSVLRSGDRVRVTAQLIRAPSAHAIWASSYERDLRDVLSLQRDVAEDIAEHVKIRLARSATQSSSTRPLDPAAHDAYLKGLYLLDDITESNVQEAIGDFNQAIAKDPNYADAYAAQAYAYVVLGTYYWPPQRTMPVAKAAALKALELDPDLSEAHVALGSVDCYYQWDWAAARQEAEKALALNPSNAHARDLLAFYYGALGKTDESLAEMERVRELAPRSSEMLGDTVFWPFFARKYDLAIRNGESAIAAEPDNAFAQVFLGMAYAEKGRTADALRHADLALQYDGGTLIASFRANVYALAGRKSQALQALRQVEKQRVEHYSCAYEIGTAYVLLDQVDRGFQWLDNAYQGHSQCMFLIKVDPRLDSVRPDPRYQSLLRKVGLAD